MQKRAVWKVIVLSLITLGIYNLIWLYKTRNELVAKGQKIPSFWLLFAPILLLLGIFVLQLVARFALGSPQDTLEGGTNLASQTVGVLTVLGSLVAVLAALPISIYWFYRYSQAVERITGGAASLGLVFGLWIVFAIVGVWFVWPGLVQDYLNKVGSDPHAGSIPDSPYPSIGQR